MNHDRARQRRLNELMRKHELTSIETGKLVGRTAAHVRRIRCGLKPVSEPLLRLLELELRERPPAVPLIDQR